MKVTFKCNNGANIHSLRKQTWDLSKPKDVAVFGCTAEEWSEMSEEEKQEVCTEWAMAEVDIYFEEE